MTTPVYMVIATAGGRKSLTRMLQGLNTCPKPAGYRGLILIENGGEKCFERVAEEFNLAGLNLTYVFSPVPSKSNALNLGMEAIPEEEALIFFSDDDVSIGADAIVAYSIAAQKHGKGHYFGGVVQRTADSVVPETWKIPFLPLSVTGWSPEKVSTRCHFLGCNWAAFKADIAAAGGFDLRFGPGSVYGAVGQETNMQERLVAMGCRSVFVEDSVVAHKVLDESTSMRWILSRARKAGVRLGLSAHRSLSGYEKSYKFRQGLHVIDRQITFSSWDRLRQILFRVLVNLARWSGILKGRALRMRLALCKKA